MRNLVLNWWWRFCIHAISKFNHHVLPPATYEKWEELAQVGVVKTFKEFKMKGGKDTLSSLLGHFTIAQMRQSKWCNYLIMRLVATRSKLPLFSTGISRNAMWWNVFQGKSGFGKKRRSQELHWCKLKLMAFSYGRHFMCGVVAKRLNTLHGNAHMRQTLLWWKLKTI